MLSNKIIKLNLANKFKLKELNNDEIFVSFIINSEYN